MRRAAELEGRVSAAPATQALLDAICVSTQRQLPGSAEPGRASSVAGRLSTACSPVREAETQTDSLRSSVWPQLQHGSPGIKKAERYLLEPVV